MSQPARTSITIRLGEDLLARIRESADERQHSMNSEIVRRLELTFGPLVDVDLDFNEGDKTIDLHRLLDDIESKMRFMESEMTTLASEVAMVPENLRPMVFRKLAQLEHEYEPLLKKQRTLRMKLRI